MKIQLEFFSILAHWVGVSNTVADLPTGADYGDLLKWVGTAYGEKMPGQLWRREKGAFAEAVGAFRKGIRIDQRTTPLKDGDVIRFMALLGGG